MDSHVSSHVHAGAARGTKEASYDVVVALAVDVESATVPSSTRPADHAIHPSGGGKGVDYMARAQWLRAAVLGANDGLVSVASLMIGVSAANGKGADGGRTMLVSGLAGLVAGACSMAIGEYVSVYVQYVIEVSQAKREDDDGPGAKAKENLPSPARAALASALAFAVGALVPLLEGGFVRPDSSTT